MNIEESKLNELAKALEAERKRQNLSREEAAAVCGVSASFIRDAESHPENCSLGKVIKLIAGLGLSLDVVDLPPAQGVSKKQLKDQEKLGLRLAHVNRRPDFGVSGEQLA
jgi:transcriptional regulator with XRE-family HTH domain